ncbi:MAG: hypothetical protein QS721_07635 [Candidatus Endonucleobacter sp. (ex Gigantidas childressi)]|nr:hypothetical protein [Candidatus Endonucleobacter sp. (ex Gigantidas childressi)]
MEGGEAIPTAINNQPGATGKCSFFASLLVIVMALKHLFSLRKRAQSRTPLAQHSLKVVIVGAGPIGFSTAIQIKLKTPDANVVMFEKYQDYARSHVLQIDPHCFNACQLKSQHLDVVNKV